MNATDYLPIVKVTDALAYCQISAGSNTLRRKDIYDNDTDDAVAAASGAAHCEKVIVAKADKALDKRAVRRWGRGLIVKYNRNCWC